MQELRTTALRSARSETPKTPDIVVVGGTGFIGRAIAKRLAADGATVTVLARSISDQRASLGSNINYQAVDIGNPVQLSDAINGAPVVINAIAPPILADWTATLAATTEQLGALTAACLPESKMFIHIGALDSLYLGASGDRITGATPPDPRASRRGFYARAKAAADLILLRLHHDQGLPLCILRPGIVIGEGGTPFHAGIGHFAGEAHCLGWNSGDTPLPFVLVDDVASAVAAASNRPHLEGTCFNLVGDVRLTAREYIHLLDTELEKPVRFHPQSPEVLYLSGAWKNAVRGSRLNGTATMTYRDLRSRCCHAEIDCSDVKHDLDWQPETDRASFIRRGIGIHAVKGTV